MSSSQLDNIFNTPLFPLHEDPLGEDDEGDDEEDSDKYYDQDEGGAIQRRMVKSLR